MREAKSNKQQSQTVLGAKEKFRLVIFGLGFLLVVFCGVTKLNFIPYHFKAEYAETNLPEGMPPFERLYYLSVGVRNELFMQSVMAYSALYDFLFLDIKPYHPPETISLFVINGTKREEKPEYQVFLDWEGDKYAEATEWLKSGEVAFAIMDEEKNEYGVPIFWRGGWDNLMSLDDNKDGVLDRRDSHFSKLKVAEPVKHIYSRSVISSVRWDSLSNFYDSVDIGNHLVRKIGSETERQSFDLVTFRTNKVDSVYMMEKVQGYNPSVFQMPELKGYGYVPNLRQAMLRDANLFQMVNSFSGCNPIDVFSNPAQTRKVIENIFYRWAGVDGVALNSRGPFIDGRKLELIEKLMAREFFQIGKWRNPRPVAANDLNQLWEMIYSHYSTRLIFQSCGKIFFDKYAFYSPMLDTIIAKGGVQQKITSDYMKLSRRLPQEKQQLFYLGLRSYITRAPSTISLGDMLFMMQQ